MDEALQAQLATLRDEVEAAAVPGDCKQSVAWCLGQLPGLYDRLRQTSESRYVDEITRLVRGALQALATSPRRCPEAQSVACRITQRLGLLHQRFGLPGLDLKPFGARPARSRKAG
jgi:hypothetical protein